MKPKIKTSVRDIVEFILRYGDIDYRNADSVSLMDGIMAHKRVQKMGGDEYTAEVHLSCSFSFERFELVISGRADGIINDGDGITVDEIKTTALPLDLIGEATEMHFSQAKCYAYMLIKDSEKLESINVRLTYYQIETGEIKRFKCKYTKEQLIAFVDDMVNKYEKWVILEQEHKTARDESIKSLSFPFPKYRKGQRELAVAVYKTTVNSKKLYACAPTGIGKTISTVFPSIKAMGEGLLEKIFYLTAKTITRIAARDACNLLYNNVGALIGRPFKHVELQQNGRTLFVPTKSNFKFKVVSLTAKEKICLIDQRDCNPDACEYAKGHFDRVNDCLYDMLMTIDSLGRDEITDFAKKHTVCPYELQMDATQFSDMIIGDYNHVFDPNAGLKRFFGDQKKHDYAFLIDEAHNLIDRAREMYSAGISRRRASALKRMLSGDKTVATKKLCKIISKINSYMNEQKDEENRNYTKKEPPVDFLDHLQHFVWACDEWLAEHKTHEAVAEVFELYMNAVYFIAVAGNFTPEYVTLYEHEGRDIIITLFCADPSKILESIMNRARASVLFSATLSPLDYYREILGGSEGDKTIALPSPFEQHKLDLRVRAGVSTKYRNREASIDRVVFEIYDMIKEKTGNYMVYFPSYEYMNQVYTTFCNEYPEVKTVLQETGMKEKEKEDFLDIFESGNDETLVGFCVLGGMFSEGIDLKGDRLIGTAIVGVGLPKINAKQDYIRDYFNEKSENEVPLKPKAPLADAPQRCGQKGFEYAYVYPGMNKVLQAAGRVIRTEEDEGVVVLIDERFNTMTYRRLFPPHWSHAQLG